MFDAFTHTSLEIDKCNIDLMMAGGGPPVLLLHGFPETKAAWHKVAPQLATEYTVILPDLPGYGDSTGPEPDAGDECHTKRAYADILVKAMTELGFDTFVVAGHDRGARVAYRMALDHPDKVSPRRTEHYSHTGSDRTPHFRNRPQNGELDTAWSARAAS